MWKLKRIYRIDDNKTGKYLHAHQILLDFLNNNNIEPNDCKIIQCNSGYNEHYEVFYKEKCTK